VPKRCNTDKDARDHERHHDHRDETNERGTDRLESDQDTLKPFETADPRDEPERDTRREAEQDLAVEFHRMTADSPSAELTASRVRSTSAMRMSPMWPMRKPVFSYGPSPAAVRIPSDLMWSRNSL